MENEKIAKTALKIAIASLFIMLCLAMIVIYILLNQIDATAGISKKVEVLESKLSTLERQNLEKASSKGL